MIKVAQKITPAESVSRATQDVALADIRYFEGNYDEAVSYYEKAIAILSSGTQKPGKALFAAYAGLGGSLSGTGNFDKARQTLETGLAVDSKTNQNSKSHDLIWRSQSVRTNTTRGTF